MEDYRREELKVKWGAGGMDHRTPAQNNPYFSYWEVHVILGGRESALANSTVFLTAQYWAYTLKFNTMENVQGRLKKSALYQQGFLVLFSPVSLSKQRREEKRN